MMLTGNILPVDAFELFFTWYREAECSGSITAGS